MSERSIAANKGHFWQLMLPLKRASAQYHQTFAQWNLILRTCTIPKHWKSNKTSDAIL